MSNWRDVIEGRAEWCVEQRDALALLSELPSGSIDAVITDPPYGMGYQSGRSKSGPRFAKIAGDDTPICDWVGPAFRSLKDRGCMVVFCEWRHAEAFRSALEASGAVVRSQLIWDRVAHGMGDLDGSFAPCHDLAWFATRGRFQFPGIRPQSVMRFQRVAPTDMVHPTMKPVDLMRHLVSTLTYPGDVVLDPFGGSGSTAVASLLDRRRAILTEIDPAYAKVAIGRLSAVQRGGDAKNPNQGALFA